MHEVSNIVSQYPALRRPKDISNTLLLRPDGEQSKYRRNDLSKVPQDKIARKPCSNTILLYLSIYRVGDARGFRSIAVVVEEKNGQIRQETDPTIAKEVKQTLHGCASLCKKERRKWRKQLRALYMYVAYLTNFQYI